MFFSRSRNASTTKSLLSLPSANGRAALESAFNVARTQDERVNVVGELVDSKVSGPMQLEFSEQVRCYLFSDWLACHMGDVLFSLIG